MDKLQKEKCFSGKSEVVRSALRLLISEHNTNSKTSGLVEGLMLVLHSEKGSIVSEIKHKYEDIIKTQLHDHLNGKCTEIFIISGNAKKAVKLKEEFESNRKIDLVKLIIP